MNSNTDNTKNLIAGGFLSGFVETGLEKPADDVSGDCIVHFFRYFGAYDMKVKLVNG